MAYLMSETFWIYPPYFMKFVIGEPQRTEPDSQRVAAFPYVLRHHAVGRRIDLRKRLADGRHPNRALSDRNVAAGPGTPTSMVAADLIRRGVDARNAAIALIQSPTAPSPAARNRGVGTHRNLRDHLVGFRVHARQQIVLRAGNPHGTRIECRGITNPAESESWTVTLLVAGSIRESTPAASDGIQMLPAPAVIPPSVFATPEGMDATIFRDFASTRCTDPLLQIGTQTLSNAIASPEQGVLATAITAPTWLVLASSCEILFLGLFEIQTVSPIATQSGDPGMENFASACNSDIGCCTALSWGPSA